MGVESFNSSISTPTLALPLQGGGNKEPNERSGLKKTVFPAVSILHSACRIANCLLLVQAGMTDFRSNGKSRFAYDQPKVFR
jgi:hypothetical protein